MGVYLLAHISLNTILVLEKCVERRRAASWSCITGLNRLYNQSNFLGDSFMNLLIKRTKTGDLNLLRRNILNQPLVDPRFKILNDNVTCFEGKSGMSLDEAIRPITKMQEKYHLADL